MRAALAVTAAVITLAVTGCGFTHGGPAHPSATPTITLKHEKGITPPAAQRPVLLSHATSGLLQWTLLEVQDVHGRSCAELAGTPDRTGRTVYATRCLPLTSTSNTPVAPVTGPGGKKFYLGLLPGTPAGVTLQAADGQHLDTSAHPLSHGADTFSAFITEAGPLTGPVSVTGH